MPTIDINARFGSYPSRYKTTTIDDLVADASTHKVDKICAISTTGSFFFDCEGNDETFESGQKYPDKVVAVATLNPKTTLYPKQAVEKIVSDGFKAIRFFAHEQGWPVDFAPFAEILGVALGAKIPVIVNCAALGDATSLAKLVKDSAHSADSIAIIEGVTIENFSEALSAMRFCSNLAIETHSLRFPDGIAVLRDVIGAERIFFGSGASAQSIGAAMHYVKSSKLTDSEQKLVLGGNAAKLLKI